MTALNIPNPHHPPTLLQRRRALTGILEHAIAALELSPTQRASVERTYKECGEHLSKALGLAQDRGDIFPQGSMRLGTVIPPLRNITDVFDLDVVFRVILSSSVYDAKSYREGIGQHLRQKYNGTVRPLPKGWRLDFSAERKYYLDVIPAMDSDVGGNVISITDGAGWRDTNPRGYASWFEQNCALMPRFEEDTSFKEARMMLNCAQIEPLPEHTPLKSPLQRIVQFCKRHRDYFFNKKVDQPSFLTASIVVTTLLTKAYARSVHSRVFQSGFDLFYTCVEDMANHIHISADAAGLRHFSLPNPSLITENLVEKWKDNRHADAFYRWHKDLLTFLRELLTVDAPRRLLTESLGARAVNAAFAKQSESISAARDKHLLTVAPSVGLGVGVGAPVAGYVIHGIR